MAGGKKRQSKAGNATLTKKKKSPTAVASFFGENDGGLSATNRVHQGKRLLLSAKSVYNGKVPEGEEGHLFQYSVVKVNKGLKTATLNYDGKFIREGGDKFENYPEQNEVDNEMEDYRMALIDEDHELYNKCIARVNAKKNDALTAAKEAEADKKKSALDDVSDIEAKIINQKMKPCEVLESEFQPHGERATRIISRGVSEGKKIITQTWGK